MTKEYVHAELGQEIRSITGYYIPEKEIKLKYKNKEVLYVFGAVVVDNSCCGPAAAAMRSSRATW